MRLSVSDLERNWTLIGLELTRIRNNCQNSFHREGKTEEHVFPPQLPETNNFLYYDRHGLLVFMLTRTLSLENFPYIWF